MNLEKVSPAEQTIVGCGVAMVLFSFLPWYGFGGATHNAWDNAFSTLAVLAAIVMVVQIVLARMTNASLPRLPFTWGRLHLVLGAATIVFIALQFLIGDCAAARIGSERVCVAWFRRFGLLFGAIAAAGLLYGGIRRSLEPDAPTGTNP